MRRRASNLGSAEKTGGVIVGAAGVGTGALDPGRQHGLPAAWEKTYLSTNRGELLEAYAEWAPTYDFDSIGQFGYAGPTAAADAFARHMEAALGDRWREAGPVLDAGAGTGQVGVRLSEAHGHANMIGIDLSPAMLAEAEDKGCYRSLICGDLTDPALIPPSSLAGLVSVGTLLLPNHIIDGSVLRIWLRWLQPGGVFTLAVRTDLWDDHADATSQDCVGGDGGGGDPTVPAVAQALESEGKWRLIETSEPALYTPLVGTIEFQLRSWVVE